MYCGGHVLAAAPLLEAALRALRPDARRLRVKPLDHLAVALIDHAALELQREGQLAAIEREFAIQQREALDGFELRQSSASAA